MPLESSDYLYTLLFPLQALVVDLDKKKFVKKVS